MNARWILPVAAIALATAGCTEENVVSEITALKEIGELAVYKVQDADFLTGKDNHVEVQYIAYTDALICVDFDKIKIETQKDRPHEYTVTFPEFTVEHARVIHDPKFSREWKVTAARGKSAAKVDNAIKKQAEREIAKKARESKYMDPAKAQAKAIVEQMIRAADREAIFSYP